MDALIPDKESRYYLKLFALTLGIGMEVLHQYFEQKILNTMDFYLFLEQYKHCLFHECYPAVQCCECCQMSLDAHPKRGCLSEIQFNILFDIAPPTNQDHYKIGRNNTVIMDCLCRIDAKRSIEVDCMDITLMCAIIKSCFLNKKISFHGNPQALETIKKTRNFLAHSCLRISKSEFEIRLAETEIAIVDMASTVGKYFKKLQQRRIEELKNNELPMETLKRIIESNADEIKKNLQTFIDEQRKTIMLNKDEIIEHLIKYKGKLEELSINIGELRFEVKQYAVSMSDSSTSEEMNNTGENLKMEATSCSSEAHSMEKDELNIQSSAPDMKTTACSTKAHTTEKDVHIKKCRVEWRLETPNTWNLAQIKESLEKFSDLLRQWFEIEFVYVGSLVIKTLVTANVLNDQDKMRNSVQSFLEKVVEVCNINTDVSSVIRVALMVSADDIEAGIQCENCKKNDNIISGLKEKLYEMSKTVSAVSLDLDLSTVFIKALKETTCFEGKTVILQCIVSGSKCIAEWLKNDEEVLYGEKVRQECLSDVIDGIHVQVYKLIISESTNEDSGTYTLKLGSKTSSCVLSVTERIPSLIKLRKYQEELAEIAVTGQNTIICVGTNAGKTYVAYHIIEDHLTKYPEGKVVFINKTNVLLEQQYSRACKVFKDLYFQGKIYKWDASLEGEYEPFPSIVQRVTLFFCTPKSLCNHLDEKSKNKISMDLFTLIVLDECHHVIRRNPFNEIMNYYRRHKFESESSMIPQVLGLTASPGTNKADDGFSAVEQLKCLMANMDVSKLSVVRKYEQELLNYSSTPTKVKIRSTERKHDPVEGILLKAITNVESVFTNRKVTSFLMQDSIETRTLLSALESPPFDKRVTRYVQWISETKRKTESVMLKDADVPRLIHICLRHLDLYVECLEMNSLLEIENVTELLTDAYELFSYESQQASTIQEREIIEALKDVTTRLREIRHSAESNPDVYEITKTLLQEYEILNDDSRFLVFVKTRASAKALAKRLPHCLKATHLTEETKSKDKAGLHIDEQLEVMGRFREGKHLCIVATSVACEGLDIPQCNLMIRYKFRVAEISSYQMRGRIRDKRGREVILASSEDFERETKNILRQYYMQNAIEQVIDLDLTAYIAIAERGIYASEVQGRLLQQRRADSKTIGAFTVNCKFCGKPVADGQFIRNIKRKITIIFDKTILTRIRREPLKKITKFDTIKKTERVFGNICGHNWGVILVYQQCDFVAISKDKVNVFDKFSKELVKFKNWLEFPYRIDEVSDEEVQRYLSQ